MNAIRPYLHRRRLGAFATGQHVSDAADQIVAECHFPRVPMGQDQTIAIVELAGGFASGDIADYFQQRGLPDPRVSAVSLGGAKNHPGVDADADGEVMLDILIAAAAYSHSTGTAANVQLFFAPPSGLADAIKAAAAHSSQPSVCSISWGGPKDHWPVPECDAMEAALDAANTAGMSVVAAAGDHGGASQPSTLVDYPASSPRVIACGTSSHGSSGSVSEQVRNHAKQAGGATGKGFSVYFANRHPHPGVAGRGRGGADRPGAADPYTGHLVVADAKLQGIGGPSAVAPLMAALMATLCRATGRRVGQADLASLLSMVPSERPSRMRFAS